MKNNKMAIACFLMTVLLFSLSACGSDTNTSTTDSQTIEEQTSTSTDQAAMATNSDQQAATADQATADPKATVDALIGSWVDINTPGAFANITKVDSGCQYEDQDNKYTATFAEGILKVAVSYAPDDVASAFIDAKTGNMILDYQGVRSEFKKK
jgi:hypothetical protein